MLKMVTLKKKSKCILSMLLTIIIGITAIPMNIHAEEEQTPTEPQSIASGACGDSLNWEITADYKLVISGSGEMYDYYESDVNDKLKLAPWAEYAADIKEITIGESVTKIGEYAFYNCSSIISITVPDNVTFIGRGAFGGTAALEEMNLPFVGQGKGATTYKNLFGYVFYTKEFEGGVKCKQTTSDIYYEYNYYLPAGLKKVTVNASSIWGGAFSGCIPLEEVHFTGEIQEIPSRAFQNCKNLKDFTISKSVSSIGTYAFDGCESMKSFTVLSDFSCYETSFDKDYVEKVYISCDVYDLYYDKATNQWIKMDFLKWIGSTTFMPCYKIHTEVSDNICVKCNADILEEQEDIYEELESSYQAKEVAIGGNTLFSPNFAFKFVAPHEDLYTFNIPNAHSIIKLSLDGNKVTEQKIILPCSIHMEKGETILAIIKYVEAETLGLTIKAQLGSDYGELIAFGEVNSKIKWILEESGTLIIEGTGPMPDYESCPVYPLENPDQFYREAAPWLRYGKDVKRLVVKEGITKIGRENFCRGMYTLYYVGEGERGDWIGGADAVFHWVDIELESVELAPSVVEVGDMGFQDGLSSEIEFIVPGTIKKIGMYAFSGARAVTLQEGVEWIGDGAFENTTINNSKLPDTITHIGERAFYNAKFVHSSLTLPNSLEVIGESAFASCETLKKVVLPEGLKIIGDEAFCWSENLEEVNMPESLEEIGSRSFEKTNLTSIKFGNNIKKIGGEAFYRTRLSYVKVPGVESLVGEVFCETTMLYSDYDAEKDGKGLQAIVVSEGVKTIEFLGGPAYGRMVLPKSITYLDYHNRGKDGVNNCLGGNRGGTCQFYAKKHYIYRDTYVDKLIQQPTSPINGLDYEYIVIAGDCGYNTYFVLTENNELVLLGEGDMYDYERAEDVPWYSYADQIENIEISRDITSIGDNAFANCTNLKSIYYPMMKYGWDTKEYMNVDNLKKIGKDSFKNCENFVLQCHVDSATNKYIYSKKIDVNVDTVENKCGEDAYWNIDTDGTLRISGTGSIEDYSAKKAPWYSYRAAIKKVVLDKNIRGIGNYAFYECNNLLSIEGMEAIQSVGSYAFAGCTKLEKLELSENCETFSVTSILNCKKIDIFHLPMSVVDITDLGEYSENIPLLLIEDEFALKELLDEYEVRYRRVSDNLIENIILSQSEIILDKNINQSVTVVASCGNKEIESDSILWSSSDQSVAKVQNGVIVAVGEGVAEIKCTLKADETIYAICNVEVHCIEEIKIEPTCEDNGYTKHQCTVCDKVVSIENEVDATGHAFNSETIGEKYMKTSNVYYKSCGKCGAIGADTFEVNGSQGKISVSSEKGYIGKTVTVSISIDENPGIINMMLNVKYDTKALKLVGVSDTGVLGDAMHSDNLNAYPYVLCWANDTAKENLDAVGTIVTMTFEILLEAEVGQSPIEVFYNYADAEVIDFNLNSVGFEISNGSVDISKLLVGDVNGDGRVNSLDRTTLARYLANWEEYTAETINLVAADVNGDGSVNNIDRIVLARHIANWDGYEMLPCDM